MNAAATVASLETTMTSTERASNDAAAEMSNAIRRMGDAIREHGENSVEALKAEQEADAAFELGETLAATLLDLESQLAAARVLVPRRATRRAPVAVAV